MYNDYKTLNNVVDMSIKISMSHVGEVLARHTMSYIGDLISQVTHIWEIDMNVNIFEIQC